MGEETLEILDARFERCVRPGAPIERLADGCKWAEGPAYLDGGVVWSDIPNDRMLRWDEATGAVSVFRAPSDFANGNTLDPQGRLVTCEHGLRRVCAELSVVVPRDGEAGSPGQRAPMAAPCVPLHPRGPGSRRVNLLLVIHASEIIEGHAQRLGQTLPKFERR